MYTNKIIKSWNIVSNKQVAALKSQDSVLFPKKESPECYITSNFQQHFMYIKQFCYIHITSCLPYFAILPI